MGLCAVFCCGLSTLILRRPCPDTGLSKHGDPVFPHRFLRFLSNRESGLQLCAGGRKGPWGCQRIGVAAIPCALVLCGLLDALL